jgi:hypothetical protein
MPSAPVRFESESCPLQLVQIDAADLKRQLLNHPIENLGRAVAGSFLQYQCRFENCGD